MKTTLTYAAFLSLLTSCAPGPKSLDLVTSKIFSVRDLSDEVRTYQVNLKTRPLLETAKREGGRIVISESEKEKIIREQDEFMQAIHHSGIEAELLFSTKLVSNTLTLVASPSAIERVEDLPMVKTVQATVIFGAPQNTEGGSQKPGDDIRIKNSVSFIGGIEAQIKYGVRGKGLRVGIIDTGIDYTHKMFGGSGSVEDYKSIDSTKDPVYPDPKKLVGGIDFVGDDYSPNSPNKKFRIPRPDKNPLDRGGHGSHVAGTVAGRGDGINTYDGVAPDAQLYAIKVFGKDSVEDAVVIAAFEYSVDPNGDLNPDDRLDVINLSLGSPFGTSKSYAEAVRNVALSGVSVVASAGNSGSTPFIVGSPSTAREAFSIGAGVDDMLHHRILDQGKLFIDGEEKIILAPFTVFSQVLKDGEEISGKLAYVGPAHKELSDELKAKVKGNIALIDRGVNALDEKAKFALKGGAIGVVFINDSDARPSAVGGGDRMSIPSVLISKEIGVKLKEKEDARFTFITTQKIAFDDLIDTVTSFSSRGPRSEDGFIKPEIIAPGFQIISAAVGKGHEGRPMNGTSMSGPHMAGVMTLMKERYPHLTSDQHRSILMGTAKIIKDQKGARYSVTSQGAGRVDVMKAMGAKILLSEAAISLGKVAFSGSLSLSRNLTVTNLTSETLRYELSTEFSAGLSLAQQKETYVLPPQESVELVFTFDLKEGKDLRGIFEGFVKLVSTDGGDILANFPVLAVTHAKSDLELSGLIYDSQRTLFMLQNQGQHTQQALPFYFLGKDTRKPQVEGKSRNCDLKSAGYRLIKRMVKEKKDDKEEEKEKTFFQVGVKTYESISDWSNCLISLQIDQNGDGVPELELVGAKGGNLKGFSGPDNFYSILLDAQKAKEIRRQFEYDIRHPKEEAKKVEEKTDPKEKKKEIKEDYTPAVKSFTGTAPFNQSSFRLVEIDLEALGPLESFQVKLATISEAFEDVMNDDYLGEKEQWHSLDISNSLFPEEVLELKAQEERRVTLKNQARPLILYVPGNSEGSRDLQEIELFL